MRIIKKIQTRRGAELNIKGKAEKVLSRTLSTDTFALKPDDFFGTIPKLIKKEGEAVQAGEPIFFSKKNPRIKFVSPVSGMIQTIQRGARRKIEKIIIAKSSAEDSVSYQVKSWQEMNREALKELLLESGNWPFIQQRPYGIIANPEDTPKAIFVSTHKTCPLGVDFEFITIKNVAEFQEGIKVLNKLVDQNVFLGVDEDHPGVFEQIEEVQHYSVAGPHPAGNVSLHIQELAPLNMGDRVWTLNPEDVTNIGRFFQTGKFSPQRTVAVTGNSLNNPKYVVTTLGCELKPLLDEFEIRYPQNRVINGDVLTGSTTSSENGHLGFFNNQITVIPEGNDYRMFGWLPFKDNNILSLSNTSFSRLFKKKGFEVDTNLNGEERALVVTGEMEKVFPLNIYPMQLIKACMVEDIEKMEALGIYEVVPEDFGLIDYANTSKIEAQEIIRQGIELMINEVG
jgi:Na+-transporting NADH:ubiquinone oxidoreductase subunit A